MAPSLDFRPVEHSAGKRSHAASQATGWQVQPSPRTWRPPTDFYETEAQYIVKVEIAGICEQDFSVSFDHNYLTIRGSRQDNASERRAYHQMEIRYGEFETTIALPGPIQVEQARAEYEDGFLRVILPKQPLE